MKEVKSKIPLHFVQTEIYRCGMEVKETSTNWMIPCPFHQETHPSLSVSKGVNVPVGVFRCFGCNESGTWNKLASHMNLRLWDAVNEESSFFVIPAKKEIKKSLSLGDGKLSEWNGKYKTYNPSFLKKFGAKKLYLPRYKADYLYLPVYYCSELIGYCRAKLNKDDPGPKYWFPSSIGKILYPLDSLLGINTACITLVEGVGDVFRLLYNGVPALAILGSALTDDMLKQLEVLNLDSIIVCLDGDEPGHKATFGYKTKNGRHVGLIERLDKYYDVRVLRPPENHDPDDMPQMYVEVLKKLNQSLGGCEFKVI